MDEKTLETGTPGVPVAPKNANSLETEGTSGLPRIRTYAADMSSAIKRRGDTLASIVNKEQTAQKPYKAKEEKPQSLQKTLLVVGTIVLVLGGIATLAAVFILKPATPSAIDASQSIIFANQTYTLQLNENVPFIEQLASVRTDTNLSLGEILRVSVTRNGVPLSSSALAEALGVPGTLAREVTGVMIGIHAFDRNQPFIIFTVSAYDRSFAAMLSWERDMGRALGKFFAPRTATSGAPTLTFSDAVIRNLDVRISGESWPLLYAFPVQKTLILTTNEFTLREILTRLNSSTGNASL